MIQKKEWETPKLTVISGIETSENVLKWTSGPPGDGASTFDNSHMGDQGDQNDQ
jgi:hypothetical protein